MRKLKLLMMTVCALMGAGQTWAQWTDVTTTYITNPSFESNGNSAASNGNLTITGWTETQSSAGSFNNTETRDASTASSSAFGTKITPADGTYYLFYRHGWNGDAGTTATFTNTSKTALPAGVYCIEFMYQQSYSEDNSSKTNTRIKFAAKNSGSEVASVTTGNATKNASFTNDGWNKSSFIFNLEEAATIDFEFTLYSGGQKRSDFLLDGIRLLKADRPATPVTTGTTDLYLFNEKESQYISAGESWGTHSIIDNTGQPMTATLSNGIYSLATQEFGQYFNELYMDNVTSTPRWLFLETEVGSGKYYMTQDGVNYLTSNGAGAELINVTNPTDASIWTIVSKDERKTAMTSGATIDNPVNATFLLADPNFGRNNTAYSSWTWTFPNGENKNNSGDNTNFVVECFQKQFTFQQTLAAGTAPAGVYSLTAQGFYRQDGTDNDHLPVFFLNDETVTFPIRGAAAENSMTAASLSFKAGNYATEPIYVRIENEDEMKVGAKLVTNEKLWCIWDNFQLKYYGDVTVAAVKMKAFVDAYNAAKGEAEKFTESSMFESDWTALQGAISTNTLDLNDPELTESDLTTATSNLNAAITAATAAVAAKTVYGNAVALIGGGTNVDLTSLIANPSFETDGLSGWTQTNAETQTNKAFDNVQGNIYAQRWHFNGNVDLNQTIAYLPAGIYEVSAYSYFSETGARLYANSTEVAVTTSKKYSVLVEIADKGSITLGAGCTSTATSWWCVDDFKLTYLGNVNDLTYTLATGKMGTDKSAAQSTAETTFLGNKTLANYNALLAAIAEAEASVAHYATLKTAIDKAEAVKEANNFVTSDATTTFANEISTATSAWTDVTYTDAQATAEIATLGTTVSGWHAIGSEGKAGAFMASAWGKDSENWWDAPYINTWSTEGDNDGSGFSVPFFEYFVDDKNNLAAKTMTATLTGLDNGCYDVEIWARVQRRSDADFNANNSMITMSVNGGDAVSIMSNTSNNVGSGTSVMRLGRYTARGMVTDGTLTLTIDVKLGSNVHWLTWRDITYTKIAGENESVTVSDAGFATYVSPAALDFTSTDIKAYKVKVETQGVATLTQVEQVPANTPVLLYKKGGATENIPVIASASAVSDNDLVAGTGEAVPTTDGAGNTNMILNVVDKQIGFYFANDKIVATNRAYLHIASSLAPDAEGPGSRMVMVFADETTGVNDVRSKMSEVRGTYYNLNGQRVEKPAKGLYIVNGKKVIIK